MEYAHSVGTGNGNRSGTKRARQREEDDDCLVEQEPIILQQLKGGPQSYKPGRRYFNVQFEDKNDAKALGALWDMEAKEWYATSHKVAKRLKRTWGELGIIKNTMFHVPKSEIEEAKKCGARFCWNRKLWYAPDIVTLRNMEGEWSPVAEAPQAAATAAPPAPPTPQKAPPTPVRKQQRSQPQTQARRANDDKDGGDCEDGNSQCVICWGAARSVGFLHGGEVHVCACKDCAEHWFKQKGTCPMCRRPAESTVIVFR